MTQPLISQDPTKHLLYDHETRALFVVHLFNHNLPEGDTIALRKAGSTMHPKNCRIVIGHNLDKIYGIYPEEETFRYANRLLVDYNAQDIHIDLVVCLEEARISVVSNNIW